LEKFSKSQQTSSTCGFPNPKYFEDHPKNSEIAFADPGQNPDH
jgi:hypothetical protein